MTDYGFTGSSEITTARQRLAFRHFLLGSGMSKFRHGDCVKADADAHAIVRDVLPGVPIHGHIPTKDGKRAFCDFDSVSAPKPYLARNADIANECDELLAMPKGPDPGHGGTWFTIRKAKTLGKPVTLFWPDGTVERV
jgi:hypothetical protein